MSLGNSPLLEQIDFSNSHTLVIDMQPHSMKLFGNDQKEIVDKMIENINYIISKSSGTNLVEFWMHKPYYYFRWDYYNYQEWFETSAQTIEPIRSLYREKIDPLILGKFTPWVLAPDMWRYRNSFNMKRNLQTIHEVFKKDQTLNFVWLFSHDCVLKSLESTVQAFEKHIPDVQEKVRIIPNATLPFPTTKPSALYGLNSIRKWIPKEFQSYRSFEECYDN